MSRYVVADLYKIKAENNVSFWRQLFQCATKSAEIEILNDDFGLDFNSYWFYNRTIEIYIGDKGLTNLSDFDKVYTGIVGDIKTPEEEDYTKTNAKYHLREEAKLLESGLIGKAEIIFLSGKK